MPRTQTHTIDADEALHEDTIAHVQLLADLERFGTPANDAATEAWLAGIDADALPIVHSYLL